MSSTREMQNLPTVHHIRLMVWSHGRRGFNYLRYQVHELRKNGRVELAEELARRINNASVSIQFDGQGFEGESA